MIRPGLWRFSMSFTEGRYTVTPKNVNSDGESNALFAYIVLPHIVIVLSSGDMQRKRTEENVKRARAMVAEGCALADVAREFGISWTTARMWTDPEYYREHTEKALRWQKDKAPRVNELAKLRRNVMTDEQRDKLAAYTRRRYANNPKVKATLKRLRDKYALTAQFCIGLRMRHMVLGYSGRFNPLFVSLMRAITGLTKDEFTKHFMGEGVFDHIVPLAAFDLTNPEHVVRANHPSNLRLVPAKVNHRKHAKWDKRLDLMTLQWSENPDAIVQAQAFVSRQLANVARRQAAAARDSQRMGKLAEIAESELLEANC